MRIATIKSLVAYLNGETVTNIDEIKAELEKELNKGAVERDAKAAAYDAAWKVVAAAMRVIGAPATIADIFAESEPHLPVDFTKAKVQYGMTHQWKDMVVKTEGKVNTYRLA